MPVVDEPLVYLPLFVLLGVAAVAVALAEWRSRRALLADGSPWPDTERCAFRYAMVLSRVETVRTVRHPALWIGIAATAAVTGRGVGWFENPPPSDLLTPIFAPAIVGVFVATHLTVNRDRQTGMDELSRTLPVGAASRTLAHLLRSAWVAVPLAVAALLTVLTFLGTDRTYQGWRPGPLELFQPAFAMLLVTTLAVATGRWWRHPIAALLIPVLLFFSPMLWGVALYMDAGPKTVWGTDQYLGTITATHLAWHWVFVAGYLTVAVVGALARHDRRPGVLTLAGVGVAAMVTGYVVKLPSWWWLA